MFIEQKRNKGIIDLFIATLISRSVFSVPTCPIPIIPIRFCLMSVEFLRTLTNPAEGINFVCCFKMRLVRGCRPKTNLHEIMVDEFLI